ncbi:MAG: radical SAM protein [Eubacterium sp.]|nr:radical SAM protein [Eubacterium sp.]
MENKLLYLPKWYFDCKLGGKKKPLQTVLFLTDYCNLACKHCTAQGHAGTFMKPFAQIREELVYSYRKGARFLDLEGGEPTLWREGKKDINTVIRLAKKIGFFSVTVTTNAQRPFSGLEADSVWVSLDGVGRVHDRIRGEGAFEKLEKNVMSCRRKRVSVNMAINRYNKNNVTQAIKYVKKNPHLDQISLNFHTPYEGTEQLEVPWEDRKKLIDTILAMKRAGYPIMNSYSGLKLMKKPAGDRPCWISNFILTDGTRLTECPGKTAGLCSRCGFSMSGEMASVMKLKPDTILAGLKLRV